MNVDNPLGVDPADPAGQDDVIIASPILHLPVDQSVRMLLRSTDVLHNFTVPQFRVKMDLVPGLVTYQWFTPTLPGNYEILCEELCGTGHFAMRGKVVVDEPAAYQAWLANQPTFAQTQARPVGNAAAGGANYAVCSACHGPQGEGNQQLNAPKLAGLDPWYARRQLLHYQTGVRGTAMGDQFGPQMAPMSQLVARCRDARERAGLHRDAAEQRSGGDGNGRRRRPRPTAVLDLLDLPWRRRPRPLGHQCAAPRRDERLVPRTAVAVLQGWRARRPSGRHLRRSDERWSRACSSATTRSRTSWPISTRCASKDAVRDLNKH